MGFKEVKILTLSPWLCAIGIRFDMKLISFPLNRRFTNLAPGNSQNSLVSNNKPLIRPYSIAYVRYIFPFWIVRPIIIRIIPILIFTGTKEVDQWQVRVFSEFFQEFKIKRLIWIFKTTQNRWGYMYGTPSQSENTQSNIIWK